MTIYLKRGYSAEVKIDNYPLSSEIIIMGNCSKSEYQATLIVSVYGVAPTVRENHGQVTGVLSY